MQKKAQIKFGEIIAVIIIVYIVLMTSLVWYNNSSSKDIRKMYAQDQSERAFEKYAYIESLDLIHVSQRGITDNEFDKNSLLALQNYTKTQNGKEHLRKQLGESLIVLKLYNYTSISNFEPYLNVTLYNNTPNNYYQNRLNYDIINYKTLISVVDENEKKVDIGLLEISVFVKKK